MIKVTVSYKKDSNRYNEEESFLIDTYNHPVAMLTAMEAFTKKHRDDDGNNTIVYVSTRNDEDVIQPSQSATTAVANVTY